jgi:putative SOS response-associated peptidase YedK
MCGRLTQLSNLTTLSEHFSASANTLLSTLDVKPRYNIPPSQDILAIRVSDNNNREIVPLHWGLIPSWAKDMNIGYKTSNARSETVATKPSYRSALKRRRCLIPTNGFYEWKRTEKHKQPYYIYREDKEAFALAGLWEKWEDPKSDVIIESCTIITTEANELMKPIHHRMPVIITPDNYTLWCDTECQDTSVIESLMTPYKQSDLALHAVSSQVNTPKNQQAGLIEPM